MRVQLLPTIALAGAVGFGWVVAGVAHSAPEPAPRFAQLALDALDPVTQRPLGDQIMKISSVGIGGPYNLLLRSPLLGQKVYDQLDYLRWHTSVPTRLNEFAILIVARQWRSQVEWAAHAPIAAKGGLSPRIIAELKASHRPAGMAADEAAVYDFVHEILYDRKVSDATFARTRATFGEQQIVDLAAVTGTYTMLAQMLEMAHQGLPAGRAPAFAPDEP